MVSLPFLVWVDPDMNLNFNQAIKFIIGY
jgi:hypothetical protein